MIKYVMVFRPEDCTDPIGIGRMHREDVTITDDDGNDFMTLHNHPVIVMDDGEIIWGCECWWTPV